jgi:hypothetical protein
MSPRSLTGDLDRTDPATPPATAAAALELQLNRPRLTVHEMQVALETARGLAVRGAGRGCAAPGHDTWQEDSTATAPPVAPDEPAAVGLPSLGVGEGSRPDDRHETWLPTHDGPVSLAGLAAPRSRAVRGSTATPAMPARRPIRQRAAQTSRTVAPLNPALSAAAATYATRIVVVPACGGAGATTVAVLLAAAVSPSMATMLVASGPDRGALIARADARGRDGATLKLAALARDEPAGKFDTATACAVFAAAATSEMAAVLDWSSPEQLPATVWAAATHVLVVAPATSPGLLAAEHAAQTWEANLNGTTAISVLTVDVRGRSQRRAGRASLARLRAVQLPVTCMPYDPALADDPRVHWPALRPRTRAAVISVLSQILSDHHRKDPK